MKQGLAGVPGKSIWRKTKKGRTGESDLRFDCFAIDLLAFFLLGRSLRLRFRFGWFFLLRRGLFGGLLRLFLFVLVGLGFRLRLRLCLLLRSGLFGALGRSLFGFRLGIE